jgi:hypothetical protein
MILKIIAAPDFSGKNSVPLRKILGPEGKWAQKSPAFLRKTGLYA